MDTEEEEEEKTEASNEDVDDPPTMPDTELGEIWKQLALEWKSKLFALYDMDTTSAKFDWSSLTGFIGDTTAYYRRYPGRVTVIELDLHDLWDELLLLAKVTPAHLPQQDQLVDIVDVARQQGCITREDAHGSEQEALTSEGTRMWTDLPFLVTDVKRAWFNSQRELDQILRHNLAAFTARLCARHSDGGGSSGSSGDGLAFCALWLLRRALEVPRRVTRSYHRLRTSVVEMLPACVVWFQFAGVQLLRLAAAEVCFADTVYFTAGDLQLVAPGERAVAQGVRGRGFSRLRWLFWRCRFEELSCLDDAEVAMMARYGLDAMLRAERRVEDELRNGASES